MSTVTGPLICPSTSDPGVYYDYTGPAGYYLDGEDLCNSWDGIPGYPCEEIEA
ncbi:hypothetical protein [Amycolatopsis sp. NPDC051371]|uniref:hypothetical protein n=1 Tax=Amycolatopsis sp. NPDC051371 TaxID=3155800 RepID=UPI00341FE591